MGISVDGIKRCAGLQGLAKSKRVSGIHRLIAEETISAPVHVIRTGLQNDVDRRAAGSSQFCGVVAPVDLKLLHCILTDRQPHAARVVVRLSPVHGNAVAPSIAAVKRESTLRSLLDAKVLVRG